MNNGSTDSEPSALTTGLNKNDSLNQLTTHVKSSKLIALGGAFYVSYVEESWAPHELISVRLGD